MPASLLFTSESILEGRLKKSMLHPEELLKAIDIIKNIRVDSDMMKKTALYNID